jgi:teichuronic acid exporter
VTIKQNVMHGIRWGAGSKYAGQLITWVMTIYVMRLLTPNDYGLVSMAGVIVAFAMLISELGVGAAIIQTKELDDMIIRQSFSYIALVCFLLFVVVYLSAPLFVLLYREPRLLLIIRLESIQFIAFMFYVIPVSLLSRHMKFKELALVELAGNIGGGVMVLLCALQGLGAISLVLGHIVIILIKTVGVNIIQPVISKPTSSLKNIGTLIHFGRKVTFSRVLWFIYSQADIIIVGKILGGDALGFYSVGMNLASIPLDRTSGILSQVAFPAYSSLQNDPQLASTHFYKAVRLVAFLFVPLLWGMSSLGEEAFMVVLGPRWEMAVTPFRLICLVVPVRMISAMVSPFVDAMGRPDLTFKSVIVAVIVMPLGFLVGSRLGITGVCLAWVLLFPMVFLFNLFQIFGNIKLRIADMFNATKRSCLAGAVMYVSVVSLKSYILHGLNLYLVLAAGIMTGILVYLGLSRMINKSCFQEIFALVKRK